MTVRRATDIKLYEKALLDVRKAGRTPLVVSTIQNPIDVMDLIDNMGFDESVVRNVNLRTKAKFNDATLNWLRQTRSGYRVHYENCLETL